jgi:hypothetical protein
LLPFKGGTQFAPPATAIETKTILFILAYSIVLCREAADDKLQQLGAEQRKVFVHYCKAQKSFLVPLHHRQTLDRWQDVRVARS